MKPTGSLPAVNSKTEIASWLNRAIQKLKGVSIEEPGLEGQLLLAEVIGKERSFVLAHPEAVLSTEQVEQADRLLVRRLSGEPLPYILGRWDFYGRTFKVRSAALIPRPETELLVEEALRWLHDHPSALYVCDVGTGSGVIAVTVALEVPTNQVTAIDISKEALTLAERNIQHLHLISRINCIQNDLLEGIESSFDVILANLPYVPSGDPDLTERIKFEPKLALDGGFDGLDKVRRLLQQCVDRINRPGIILLELDYRQGAAARALAMNLFPKSSISILQDLAGLDRVLKIEVP